MGRPLSEELLPITNHGDRKYYADNYKCWPPPFFILSITAIQLSVFVYYTAITGEMTITGPVPLESPFIYRPDKRHHIWRFLIYAFLHAGYVHLAFNLVVQVLVGLPLEMVHGWWRVLVLYVGGVLAGSLATSVLHSDIYLLGASGGVYALMAAHLPNVMLNYNSMHFAILRLLGVIFVACADIGFALFSQSQQSDSLPVSYISHLSGAMAGLALGVAILRSFDPEQPHAKLTKWVATGLYTSCVIFAMLYNIMHSSVYQPSMHSIIL
ncbi:unnamed protein product [Meganyctiphanes norvegica]|uniref:rhomboid protease n=1 Tax=Meganyctiphanes norvegica TaxID=48144 RepID=A0AAV2QWW3_MEGNR